jgi:hypothetical protein
MMSFNNLETGYYHPTKGGIVQIIVEAVTKEPRIFKGQTQWGVKLPGNGGWVTLYREAKPAKGETIDVNITERRGNNGQSYKDAFPVMPPLAPEPVEVKAAPKQITWDSTREFIKAAHNVALVLEPDEIDDGNAVRTDRSTARAAITNTLVIAYTSGKILVPDEADEYTPPPADEGAPF